jgi:hypothetical protein
LVEVESGDMVGRSAERKGENRFYSITTNLGCVGDGDDHGVHGSHNDNDESRTEKPQWEDLKKL